MAYYPPDFVDRIRLIKQLQEERFMPLKLIKGMLDKDPDRARALVEIEDRVLERVLEAEGPARMSAPELRRRYDMPRDVLDKLGDLGVLTPNSRGYSAERRPHRRGDRPLPRRRHRRADRLHGVRHAALQAGDG